MAKIIFYKGKTGIEYINPVTLIISNLLYPNFYLSILYFFYKRIRRKYQGSQVLIDIVLQLRQIENIEV